MKSIFIFISVITIMLPMSVIADSSNENNTYDEVIVSATRVEGPELPTATSITVISQEEIQVSGVSKLSELLRTQAGIQIQDADGSGGRNVTISMRGFGANAANNTLILVDGRKLNNPSLAAPDLNSIVLGDIERIEIVHGSAGVLYGDQAVGGVINIITKRAQAGDSVGTIEASFGSDDLKKYSASLSQGFDNGLSYRVSGVTKNTDNYRDNNEASYDSGLINIRYDHDYGHVFAEAQKIDDDLRLPGSISEMQFKDDPRQTNTPNDFSDRDTGLARFGGRYDMTKNWSLLGEYSWRDEDTKAYFYSPYEQYTRAKNFTPRLQGVFDTSSGVALVTFGYDRVRASHEISEYFTDAEQDIDAYYGQLVYPITRSLTATVGMRISKVEDRNFSTGAEQNDDLEAYEGGVSYQLFEDVRLFARYADAFRFANVDENGFTLLPFGEFLKPQTSDSKELGIEWNYDLGMAKVVFYDMDIENEIYYDSGVYNYSYQCDFPSSGDICDIYGANVNLPDSNRKGLIVEASYELTSALRVRGNYTYTDAGIESGSFSGNEVPYVSKNTASLAITYNITEQLSMYVDANYTGSRYRLDDDSNAAGRIDTDTIINANFQWQYQSWMANLRVSNLTDEEYTNYQSVYGVYPQPGTTAEATVSYRF